MQSQDKILTLDARIRVLVDKLAEQATTFDKMQNKMFTLVGLLLTLGGLFTYDIFKIKKPDTVLEYIILIAALALIGLTAILIGYDYRAKKNWLVPIGPVEEVKLDNAKDYEAALEIIHTDYVDTYHGRADVLDKKARILNLTLYMFVAAVILLVLLKIGG